MVKTKWWKSVFWWGCQKKSCKFWMGLVVIIKNQEPSIIRMHLANKNHKIDILCSRPSVLFSLWYWHKLRWLILSQKIRYAFTFKMLQQSLIRDCWTPSGGLFSSSSTCIRHSELSTKDIPDFTRHQMTESHEGK